MAQRMLYSAPMRLVFGALLLASMTSVASAGTYIGLGIGSESTGSATRSDGADSGTMDGYGRSGRLILGRQFTKNISIEGQASRFDVTFDNYPYDATQVAAALKLSLPLGNNFELFGRGGLEHTWMEGGNGPMYDASGNGWLFGAGFEYRFDLGVTGASVFVDYQRTSTDFENTYMLAWTGSSSMWTLGATISF